MRFILYAALVFLGAFLASLTTHPIARIQHSEQGLWATYYRDLESAKYVDLTHTITPAIPVWKGFGPPAFSPAKSVSEIAGFTFVNEEFSYEKHGFEATSYTLSTDQLGTQLDPPAHWAPNYPAIDELPATYTLRPLVVISIAEQVRQDFGYSLTVRDILDFENTHGRIPEGSVVFVHSGWSEEWPSAALAQRTPFPGVSLSALKLLHLERKILFHGHEPLDTDASPNFESEAWLMHNGYTQAEGVTNLDKVPPTGALVAIGFPKFGGGLGGYARFVAICPPDWAHGVTIAESRDAPLPRFEKPLVYDSEMGMRLRR
jgi:kynurenine formamidase